MGYNVRVDIYDVAYRVVDLMKEYYSLDVDETDEEKLYKDIEKILLEEDSF